MAKYPSKSSMVGMIALALVSSVALAAKPNTGGGSGGGGGGSKGGGGATNPVTVTIGNNGTTSVICNVAGSGLIAKQYADGYCNGQLTANWYCRTPSGYNTAVTKSGEVMEGTERVIADRKGRANVSLDFAIPTANGTQAASDCLSAAGNVWEVCSVEWAGWVGGFVGLGESLVPATKMSVNTNCPADL